MARRLAGTHDGLYVTAHQKAGSMGNVKGSPAPAAAPTPAAAPVVEAAAKAPAAKTTAPVGKAAALLTPVAPRRGKGAPGASEVMTEHHLGRKR